MKAKQVLSNLILLTSILAAPLSAAEHMCLSLVNYSQYPLTLQAKEGEGSLAYKDFAPRNLAEKIYAGTRPFYFLGLRMESNGKLEAAPETSVHDEFDFFPADPLDEDMLIVLEVFFSEEPNEPRQDLPISYDENMERSNSTLNYDSHCPGFSLSPHEHTLKVSPSYEQINRTHHIVVTVIDGGRCPSAIEKVSDFVAWFSSE